MCELLLHSRSGTFLKYSSLRPTKEIMSPFDQKFLKSSMTRHYIHSYKLPLNLTALQSHLEQKIQRRDWLISMWSDAFWSQSWDMVYLEMLLHLV